MQLPLISHPRPTRPDQRPWPDGQATSAGDLRLTAHSRVVTERAHRLFSGSTDQHRVLHVLATLHDFGKATPQFQAHVRLDEHYEGPDEQRYHARLGALATWFVLDQLDISARDQFAALLAVARHHQALPDTAPYTTNTLAQAFDGPNANLKAQLDSIEKTWSDAPNALFERAVLGATDGAESASDLDISWTTFSRWVRSGTIVDELHALSGEQGLSGEYYPQCARLPPQLYDRTLHYWGSLTLADKSHAKNIDAEQVFSFPTLDAERIDAYVYDLQQDSSTSPLQDTLNDYRKQARQQVIKGVHEWLAGDGIPRLAQFPLPTGFGKTLSGISAGIETRDLLDRQQSRETTRPIVYALPYTSIIEQTRELFEKPALWGANPERAGLTVHHYLSETLVFHDDFNDDQRGEDTMRDLAITLGESWRDGIILTTFVQLFESLAGPSNTAGMKLPALDGGVLILDEPQALPKDWWDGVPRLLDLLTEEFGTHIISMTATQPALFQNTETLSLLELGERHDPAACPHCVERDGRSPNLPTSSISEYYRDAERVEYTLDETALAYHSQGSTAFLAHETAADRLLNVVAPGESVMAVCNTIASTRALTQALLTDSQTVGLGETVDDVIQDANIDAADPAVSPLQLATRTLVEIGIKSPADEGDEWINSAESPIFVLTFNGRYRPFDRRVLVHLISQLSTAPIPFILVSSQAIEAGVDVSFRRVYRDLAPIDSIVQAAGRCNRSYEWGQNGGDVVVWMLADPDEPTPADPKFDPPAYYIYEQDTLPGHLSLIAGVLADLDQREQISDVALSHQAVQMYFNTLNTDEWGVATTDIRDHVDSADGYWLANQSLIDGYETRDVLVATTPTDRVRVYNLVETFRTAEVDRNAYNDLAAASALRVSVPADLVQETHAVERLDGRVDDADGPQVYWVAEGQGLRYDLIGGGLRGREERSGNSAL